MKVKHPEKHRLLHAGWLRAAVLGANDGIVSTASLIVGVAAAGTNKDQILLTGVAGLAAGAMSMAAGEYVSVSSQADTEKADLAREKLEIETDAEFESEELKQIYIKRGLTHELAAEVSRQMMAHDALGSHARDELGLIEIHEARPVIAAFASAGTFAVGAFLPLLTVFLFEDTNLLITRVSIATMIFLAALGSIAAKVGGANPVKGALRVMFWGALAMLITAAIGGFFGVTMA